MSQVGARLTRGLLAVVGGTFVLRFSTGLTGGLLLYYLARLHEFGGPLVTATMLGVVMAAYYVAELMLSPVFGIASDRWGARRVMQIGPIVGALAVLMTALTTNVTVLGFTRWLEGAAAAASIPSVLGYIAFATSRDELLRGKTVARFEAATLAGIGMGMVAAGPLYEVFGRSAFYVNAGVYLISLLIFRYGTTDPTPRDVEASVVAEYDPRSELHGRFDLDRYRRLLRSSHVWLLAPTWIALNAFIGVWLSQSLFQLVQERSERFEGQLLMGGFTPTEISIGLLVALVVFFVGLMYWGGKFKRFKRTTLIGIGIAGGLAMLAAIFAINVSADWTDAVRLLPIGTATVGLFVLAAATPAALGLLADISEGHPHDRGAIMGLYSVFLALGQISGSIVGGGAADWGGVNGLLAVSAVLLAIALLPLYRLRRSEHLVDTVGGEHRAVLEEG